MFMSDRVHDWYEIASGAGVVIGELSEQTYDSIGLDSESHKSATWKGRFQTYRAAEPISARAWRRWRVVFPTPCRAGVVFGVLTHVTFTGIVIV